VERGRVDIGVDLFLFVYLFFVIIIYVISFIALRSGEIFKLGTDHITELISFDHHTKDQAVHHRQAPLPERKRDTELSLHEEELENELNDRLVSFMNDSKPYLNPDLSLQSLAEALSVSRHQLSATINKKQNMNFFEFVNLYRVNEVKELMKKDIAGTEKNYELAYEAGFNSKATFYRIFKKLSGQTPSDYRASAIRAGS
jgi:YesN/AraC family two-component response regulator